MKNGGERLHDVIVSLGASSVGLTFLRLIWPFCAGGCVTGPSVRLVCAASAALVEHAGTAWGMLRVSCWALKGAGPRRLRCHGSRSRWMSFRLPSSCLPALPVPRFLTPVGHRERISVWIGSRNNDEYINHAKKNQGVCVMCTVTVEIYKSLNCSASIIQCIMQFLNPLKKRKGNDKGWADDSLRSVCLSFTIRVHVTLSSKPWRASASCSVRWGTS